MVVWFINFNHSKEWEPTVVVTVAGFIGFYYSKEWEPTVDLFAPDAQTLGSPVDLLFVISATTRSVYQFIVYQRVFPVVNLLTRIIFNNGVTFWPCNVEQSSYISTNKILIILDWICAINHLELLLYCEPSGGLRWTSWMWMVICQTINSCNWLKAARASSYVSSTGFICVRSCNCYSMGIKAIIHSTSLHYGRVSGFSLWANDLLLVYGFIVFCMAWPTRFSHYVKPSSTLESLLRENWVITIKANVQTNIAFHQIQFVKMTSKLILLFFYLILIWLLKLRFYYSHIFIRITLKLKFYSFKH